MLGELALEMLLFMRCWQQICFEAANSAGSFRTDLVGLVETSYLSRVLCDFLSNVYSWIRMHLRIRYLRNRS